MNDTVKKRLMLILGVDAKTFDRDIKSVESKIHSMSQSVNTGVKRIALGLIGSGGLLTLLAKGGLATTSSFEQMRVGLTGLYGSAEIATRRFEQLRKMAIDLPFDLPEIVQAQIAFDRFGISMEKWMPLLGDWATAMKLMGADLGSLIDAMARITQGGAGAQRAFMTFLRSGVTKKQLAEFGVLFDEESMKLLSTTSQTLDGLERLIKEKFGGAMQRQQGTFQDIVSDTKEMWHEIQEIFSTPLFEAVKKDLVSVQKFLQSPEGRKWAKELADVMVYAYEKVKALIEKLMELGGWLVEKAKWFDKNVANLEDVFIVAVFVMAGIKVLDLVVKIKTLEATLAGSAIFMGFLKIVGGGVGSVFAEGLKNFGKVVTPGVGAGIVAADFLRGKTLGMAELSGMTWQQREEALSGMAVPEGLPVGGRMGTDVRKSAQERVKIESEIAFGFSDNEKKVIEDLRFAWSGYYDFRIGQIEKEAGMIENAQLRKAFIFQQEQQLAGENLEYLLKLEDSRVIATQNSYEKLQAAMESGEALLGSTSEEYTTNRLTAVGVLTDTAADKQEARERRKADIIMSIANRMYGTLNANAQMFVAKQISLGEMLKNNLIMMSAETVKAVIEQEAQEYVLKAAAALAALNFPRAALYAAGAAVLQTGSAVIDSMVARNISQPDAGGGIGGYDGGGSVSGGGRSVEQLGTTIRGQTQNITISPVITISGETVLIGSAGIQELKDSIGQVAVDAVKDALMTGEIVVV